MHQPFENAKVLLDFLEADEPERYVFRGQTQAYNGPMLPSGIRDRFTTFESSTNSTKWAGVSTPQSVIKKEVFRRWEDLSPMTLEAVEDRKTSWDLPESAFQMGFLEFFNQPHSNQNKVIGSLTRESAIPAMGVLMGNDLADLLCQQYGFTSIALDVSTDPSVAIFFSTHKAPFYSLVTDSLHLGVVYRWPRERAMIAQNILVPLEGSGFESITTSFHNFIKDSPDLKVTSDTLIRNTSANSERQMRIMSILSEGDRRSFNSLRFPIGAFNRSRMGRQCAALLFPDFEVVKPLMPGPDGDFAALIGDLLKTHHGEAFYFRHSASVILPERLNKFILWPSIKSCTEYSANDFRLKPWHDHIKFEDIYLEMMLRFFSTCSPFNSALEKLVEPGNPQSLHSIGLVNGVVDLGYELHPSDAVLIAESLRDPEIYMPIPLLRHIPTEYVKLFQAKFAEAITFSAKRNGKQ